MLSGAAQARRAATPLPLADVAAELIGGIVTSDDDHDELVEMCDTIGHRLTGSPAPEKAIDWARAKMAEHGLETQAQPVPRGQQPLTMVEVRRAAVMAVLQPVG
jgi:hypothetical protein